MSPPGEKRAGPMPGADAASITMLTTATTEAEVVVEATAQAAPAGARQPALAFGGLNVPQDDVEGQTIAQRFESFHRRNPGFYAALIYLARRFRNRTGRTCGIQRLIEVARHDIEINTISDDEFKINNSFAPFYARLIMLREPDLGGFFRLRKAEEADAWIASMTTDAAA